MNELSRRIEHEPILAYHYPTLLGKRLQPLDPRLIFFIPATTHQHQLDANIPPLRMPLQQQGQRFDLFRMVLFRTELRKGYDNMFPRTQIAKLEEFLGIAWRVDDTWRIMYELATVVVCCVAAVWRSVLTTVEIQETAEVGSFT